MKILRFLIVIIVVSYGCQAGKRVSDFKEVKQSIDTISIIPAFIEIKEIGLGDKITIDTLFSREMSDSISNKISQFLFKKYQIKKYEGYSSINNDVANDLNQVYYELDNSKKIIPDIEIPNSIFQNSKNYNDRYCIITFVGGLYKTDERIAKDEKDILPASIAVAVLSLGHVYLVPSNPASSTMRLILYDKVMKKVLYYKKSTQNGIYPTNISTIDGFIYENLKGIYYK